MVHYAVLTALLMALHCHVPRDYDSYSKNAWEEIIGRCEEINVDAFEINFSCPHGLPERRCARFGVELGPIGSNWARDGSNWARDASNRAGDGSNWAGDRLNWAGDGLNWA